ncbi:hypothetical protein B0A55_01309 [Friedmanniomyces simplex]|uniref:RanBD1 domain-containing protein n=1 Tax=Friedmanniomyces simplex TaxID=329884 RepID=A0A4U0Y0S6_9PEZI|nr:hypothetical protein B0A55_01309 [Friedmanniomyces simplex]
MAPTADNPPLSDTETAEKPVREQLKKASIAGLPLNPQTSEGTSEDLPVAEEHVGENGSRGRLQRKRSFEEVEGEHPDPTPSEITRQHTRKRSRDSTAEEVELNNGRKVSGERPREVAEAKAATTEANGDTAASIERPGTPKQAAEKHIEAAAEAIASPKTKRSRLHSTTADDNGVAINSVSTQEAATDKAAPVEPVEAKPAKTEDTTTEVPRASGFANTAAVSPFGALAGSKSPSSAEAPQTSSSAFTSSGFGSLAGSTSSGFGAIGKSTGGFGAGGGFAMGSKSVAAEPSKESVKPEASASTMFGGALGQKSAFAAAPAATSSGFGSGASSGFGKLGGGFGLGLGGGLGSKSPFGGATTSGGLNSFASSKSATPLGGVSKPTAAKPFGAPADEEEEGEEGGGGGEEDFAGIKSPGALSQDEDKQDERFYAQSLETGEEDEETEYSCRAKVYNYATTVLEDGSTKKEWRERGLGILRFNVNRGRRGGREEDVEGDGDGEGEAGKPKARFLMRADGSHRVVLNTPVKKEIQFGAAMGGPPQGGLMLFLGTIEGRSGLEMLQVKMRQQYAVELHEKIVQLQSEM